MKLGKQDYIDTAVAAAATIEDFIEYYSGPLEKPVAEALLDEYGTWLLMQGTGLVHD